jgi:hypothetical protein
MRKESPMSEEKRHGCKNWRSSANSRKTKTIKKDDDLTCGVCLETCQRMQLTQAKPNLQPENPI